jgi:hypothetical protein
MRNLLIALVVIWLGFCAQAQTPVPVEQPQFLVAAGAGFNHYETPQTTGFLTAGVRVADKTYSLTSIDMASTRSSMRTGVARVLIERDNFVLLALGDAGVATGGGAFASAYSAGGIMAYEIGKWLKMPRLYAMGAVRVLRTAIPDTAVAGGSFQSVQPKFEFGVAKAF